MAHTKYKMKDFEEMQHELNWSGTAGLNLHTQKQLAEDAIELQQENDNLKELLTRALERLNFVKNTKNLDEAEFPVEDFINELEAALS